MADDPLFTIKQLADQLGLPESTVRYYRDAFLDHIPSVGTGRRRRYPAQAVAVLRTIATHYAAGQTRAEIVSAIEHTGGGPAVHVPQSRAAPRSMEEVSNLDLLAAILDGERVQRDALWQMANEIVRLTEVMESQDKVLTEVADRAGVIVSGRPPLPLAAPAARLSAGPQAVAPPPQPHPQPPPPVAAPAPPPPAPPVVPPPAAPIMPPAAAPPVTPPAAPVTPPATPITPLWAAEPTTTRERETAPLASTLFGEPPRFPEQPLFPDQPRSPWGPATPAAPPVQPAAPAPAAPHEPTAPRIVPSARDDIERLRIELEAERELVERLRESKLLLEHRVADAEASLEDKRSPRRPSVLKRLLGGDNTE